MLLLVVGVTIQRIRPHSSIVWTNVESYVCLRRQESPAAANTGMLYVELQEGGAAGKAYVRT